MRVQFSVVMALTFAAAAGNPAAAVITTFTNRPSWEAAVGDFTTIGFNEVPDGAVLTTQYSHLGVTFVDGNDMTEFLPAGYPNDDYGLVGTNAWWGGDIRVHFDTPQHWIAVDFPGNLILSMYRDSRLIGSTHLMGQGIIGDFGGAISSIGFDEVRIWDPGDNFVFIDDLHWGVPAPGTVAVLGFTVFFVGSRRRRE